jgi:NAD(P)-dependent dehydrogenase (short-subunit alcohol dehydrogenase family)
MKIRDSVAFVTGANRGIGLAFAQQLLAGGARKVYAAARQPEAHPLAGVERVRLDVTNPEDVAAAAGSAPTSTCSSIMPALRSGLVSSRPIPSRLPGQKWRPTTMDRSS